jgi:hypothetical protein
MSPAWPRHRRRRRQAHVRTCAGHRRVGVAAADRLGGRPVAQVVQPPSLIETRITPRERPPRRQPLRIERALPHLQHPRPPSLSFVTQADERLDGSSVEADHPAVGRLRRCVAQRRPALVADGAAADDLDARVDRQSILVQVRPTQCTQLGATRSRHRRQTQREAGCRISRRRCGDGGTDLVGRQRLPRLGLAAAKGGECDDIVGNPAPSCCLGHPRTEHEVLVTQRGLANSSGPDPGMPPVDIGDRETADLDPGDRVSLDQRDATRLVTDGRRCPRRCVGLQPRVHRLGHGPPGERRRRGDRQLCGGALGVPFRSAHGPADLLGPAPFVGADEDAHLPHVRPTLADRCHRFILCH